MFDEIDKDNDHEISKAELYDFFIEYAVVDFTQQAKSLKEKSQKYLKDTWEIDNPQPNLVRRTSHMIVR